MAKMKDRAKPLIPPPEPGLRACTCVYSIDVGEQLSEYGGKKRYQNKFILGFELADEYVEVNGEAEPRVLSRWFTFASGANAGIRAFANTWNGRQMSDAEAQELDSNDFVGRTGMINVVLNEDGTRANVESVMPLMKGLPQPKAVSKLIRFDMDPWDQAAFEALPEWAQEIIKKSTQYQKEHPSTDAIQVQEEAQKKGTVPF